MWCRGEAPPRPYTIYAGIPEFPTRYGMKKSMFISQDLGLAA